MHEQIEIVEGNIRPIEVYKEAWEIIKPNFWLFFAISIVGIMIGGLTMYVLLGAMVCGILYCFLGSLEGVEPKIDDLFKGLKYWLPSLVVVLVLVVPTIVVIGMVYVPILVAAIMGGRMSQDELMGFMFGVFAAEFVLIVIMTCVHTLFMFSFHLIVDKNLSGWNALKTSARGVWRNLHGVAGLWAVGFILSLAGMLLFCVGTYLTLPIMLAAHTVAYRKIFPGTFTGIELT